MPSSKRKITCARTYPCGFESLTTEAHIFLNLFQNLNGDILSVVEDITLSNENASGNLFISSISRNKDQSPYFFSDMLVRV